jgi:hypothetical protein
MLFGMFLDIFLKVEYLPRLLRRYLLGRGLLMYCGLL